MSECVKCGSTTLAEATQPKEHPSWCDACWDLLRDFDHKERHGVTLAVLRDMFAGMAMQALVPHAAMTGLTWEPGVAGVAYRMADAMLAAREKRPEDDIKQCERCGKQAKRLDRVVTQDDTLLCLGCFKTTRYPQSSEAGGKEAKP